MARDSKYSVDELEVVKERPMPFGPPLPKYNYPITPKENIHLLYEGKTPMWAPMAFGDTEFLMIDCDPENMARSPDPAVTKDGWGVEWVYEPEISGAIEVPGQILCKDINHWEDYVTVPDPDTWDWAGCVERTAPKFDPDYEIFYGTPGVLFERLIAIMDYGNAAMALVDDDEKEAVHRFFRVVTDVRKKIYKNVFDSFHPYIANFNDDWGTQRAPAFAVDTVREMLMPYAGELCAYVHSLGMKWDLHCCGYVEPYVPLFVEMGYDSWGGQPMNDKAKLKREFGDKMIFTGHITCAPDADDVEQQRVIDEFFAGMGADNRCYVSLEPGCPSAMNQKVYETSRKNYDRLVAEGKAVF